MATIVEKLNRRIESSARNKQERNDRAALLTVCWEESDLDGVEDEAKAVRDFFESELRFTAEHFSIPSQTSFRCLVQAIAHFLQQHASSAGLLVIHYGGHGDENADRDLGQQNLSVWAAKRSGGPSVDWFNIQPMLEEVSGADVVLLLDCCHAAQAARSSGRGARFELLAACSMGQRVLPPSENSFTRSFLRELKGLLISGGSASIAEIHRRLLNRASGYNKPVYVELDGGRRKSVVFRPLEPTSQGQNIQGGLEAELSLRLSLAHEVATATVDEIGDWLTIELPGAISKVQVRDLFAETDELAHLVQRQRSSSWQSAALNKISAASKSEIMGNWSDIEHALSDVLILRNQDEGFLKNPIAEIATHGETQHTLGRLRNAVNAMKTKLEAAVLESAYELDEDELEAAKEDEMLSIVDLKSRLHMHQIARFKSRSVLGLQTTPEKLSLSDNGNGECVTASNMDQKGSVFIEYHPYPNIVFNADFNALRMLRHRVEQLAILLHEAKAKNFRVFHCIHWFEDAKRAQFGLVLEPPLPNLTVPLSLQKAIHERQQIPRPSLTERFQLALTLACALEEWHAVGWVHQNISSRNVTILCSAQGMHLAWNRPFLCGFESSRRYNERSLGLYNCDDFDKNIYNHPDRQRPPISHSRKEYDIYSLGVVLLEVGEWICAHDFFPLAERDRISGLEIRRRLESKAKRTLAHYMGEDYRQAVVKCLSGDFAIESDNASQRNLAESFRREIIMKIERGIQVFRS